MLTGNDQPTSTNTMASSPTPTTPPIIPPNKVGVETPSAQPRDGYELSAGTTAGVAIGAVLGTAILVAAAFGVWWFKKRNSKGLLSFVPRRRASNGENKFETPDDVAQVYEEPKIEEDPRPKSELSGIPAERPKSELPG